jgi:nicotinamide mononucleotide transporter
MQSLLHLFIEQIKETTWVQWLAVALGVAEVLLARVNNIWLYPAGILGTALSILLLMEVQLYAESLLNVYYIVMSVYGWVYWIKKRDQPPVKITWSTRTEWIISLSISLGGWAVLYFLLRYFTPSNVPLWDAFVSFNRLGRHVAAGPPKNRELDIFKHLQPVCHTVVVL